MRKLMMTSTLVVPLLAAPAYAQEAPAQPEGESAGQAAPIPEGPATGAGEAEVEVETEEPQVDIAQEEPAVEVIQAEPEVEIVQEPAQVETTQEGAEEAEGEAPAMTEDPTAAEPAETAEEPAGPTPEAVVSEMGADELRGDWVIGTTVVSPQDETIGQIQDVIITPDGQVSAAILSVGGFLGLGAKNIAVDWSELEIAQDGQEITLDLTREEAENAPEYAFREQAQPEPEAGMAPPAPAPEATPAPEAEPAAPAQ